MADDEALVPPVTNGVDGKISNAESEEKAESEEVEKETSEAEKESSDDDDAEKKPEENSDATQEGNSESPANPAPQPVWENGRYVFIDPTTKKKQYYDEASSQWLPVTEEPVDPSPKDDSATDKPSDSAPDGDKYEIKDGTYRCKDDTGKDLYWDVSGNQWRPVEAYEYFTDEKTGQQCYKDPSDGMVYEWEAEKQAWLPKIDDDFLAVYHLQYGVNQTEEDREKEEQKKEEEKKKEEVKAQEEQEKTRKRKADPPSWFEMDNQRNTNVYVQGLPMDTTDDEFLELMSKCGLVAKDPDTGKMKVKLYRHEDGKLKGDARCCYIRRESVELALQILDGYNLRGFNLKVEQAQFTLKGAYDPSKKPRKKKKQEKEKLKKMQDKLLAWKPDELRGQRPRSDKVVVIKNLFDPEDFKKDPKLILDLQTQLVTESQKFGGAKKVVVHDRHPDGVAELIFKEFEHSDLCVQIMHRRTFGDRKLIAALWDGKTKYRIEETEEEKKERLGQWEKFLEAGEEG